MTWTVVLHAVHAPMTEAAVRQTFHLSVSAASVAAALFAGLDSWRGAATRRERLWELEHVEVRARTI